MGQTIIYSIPFFGVLSLIYMFWKSAWVSRQEEGTPKMAAIAKGDFAGYLHPQLNAVPVNFLSNVDTTGGNSGSPTFNGNAELVGLLFDTEFVGGPPFGGNKEEYSNYFSSLFDFIHFEPCYNSIAPRAGKELFVELKKIEAILGRTESFRWGPRIIDIDILKYRIGRALVPVFRIAL